MAIMGFGGLGHMALKFAKAMGIHITVISRNSSKKEMLKDLKIDGFLDMSKPDEVKAASKNFDFMIDTISAPHDIN